jgi:hypothetical protein
MGLFKKHVLVSHFADYDKAWYSLCGSDHLYDALFPQDDPRYKMAAKFRKPEQRLRYFTHLCAGKKKDEASGGLQPAYKLESMKIIMEFPKSKDPEAEGALPESERKQVRPSALFVRTALGGFLQTMLRSVTVLVQ